jgi:hypothetical protein
VDPIINSTNLKDISEAVTKIKLGGKKDDPNYNNTDCPEHSLHGIQEALKYAGPKSILFVFTDDDANDLEIKDQILNTLQEKQVTVNFFFSKSSCGWWQKNLNKNRPGFTIYETIAKSTNGLLSSMKKSDVKNVLQYMSTKIDPDFSLTKAESIPTGLVNTTVEVSKSTSEISVTVQGPNPSISIQTPNNETVEGILLGNDIATATIENPAAGNYIVTTNTSQTETNNTAETNKTSKTERAQLQIGVKDTITLDYGFSLVRPLDKSKTRYQPIEGIIGLDSQVSFDNNIPYISGAKNFLSVFVSTPGKVQNLKTVTFFDDNGTTIAKFDMKRIDDTHYVTAKIEIPKNRFKMKAEMTNVGGYTTTRIISKNIQSVGVAKRTGMLDQPI